MSVTDGRSLHRNHRAFWRHMARAAGGSVTEVPGGLLVATGIAAAPFNQVHCDPGAPYGEVLERAAGHFGALGLPWRVVCEEPSPQAEAFCKARGREPEPLYPILSRAVGQDEPPADATGLAMSVAESPAHLREFIECAGACYDHDPSLIAALVSGEAVADDRFRFHLGRWEGKCVAISVGVREGDTVGVYFVGVRPEYRGRGFGRAVTQRVLSEGAAGGAVAAVLQATPAGYPLYLRMGFRHVADYRTWDLPLPAGEAGHAG